MKRTLAMLLLTSFMLCFLIGCEGVGGYYGVSVTGDKDSLMEPIKPFYKAGDVVEIKAYPVTDVSLYVFVNGESVPMSHYDSDYWGFEFVMPKESVTIHLTYDQFYGKEKYTFNELHVFLGNDIFKVYEKTVNYSEKYSFIETRYSTRQLDIDNFKAIVEQRLIKVDNEIAAELPIGREYGFCYGTEGNTNRVEALEFNGEFFAWSDFMSWQAFRFEDENYALPTIEDPELITYSFRYDGLSSDIRSYDDESFSQQFFHIGLVEFIPYIGEAIESDSPFYLDSRYGNIKLLSPMVFELNGDLYEIISGSEYWAYSYCNLGKKG